MKRATTPVRQALRQNSSLRPRVEDGLGAVKRQQDRERFASSVRAAFADSLELDEAMREDHQQDKRWDFLLGHRPSKEVIAVEIHGARSEDVTAVIGKRTEALKQLRDHLAPGSRVSRWLWVASGRVHFAPTGKDLKRLDQNGIEFIGTPLLPKHLPKGR